MTDFDKILADSTARGANVVHGAVMAAVDKNGKTFFSRSSGYRSLAPDAEPIDPNATFWMASCSKIVSAIAAMQCVERGQVTLDEPVSRILPELANPDIIKIAESGTDQMTPPFTMTAATRKITLRQLLTHTSGLAYDFIHPTIMAWRASRGEVPMTLSGKVMEAYSTPLIFEPGEGWTYGPGLDWAAIMAVRLNGNATLEEYMSKNIFKPLGLTVTTFRREKYPEISKRLLGCTERQEDGTLKESHVPWPDEALEDAGGAGLYSSVPEYLKIIGDLVKERPTLLEKETVEQMLTPQYAEGSPVLSSLSGDDAVVSMTGSVDVKSGFSYGLSGFLLTEDFGVIKKGTLMWGGLPNLTWMLNREHGFAAFFATQVIPPFDRKCYALAAHFKEEVLRVAAAK